MHCILCIVCCGLFSMNCNLCIALYISYSLQYLFYTWILLDSFWALLSMYFDLTLKHVAVGPTEWQTEVVTHRAVITAKTINISIYTSISLQLYISTSLHLYISTYLHLFIYISISMHLCISISLYLYISISLYLYISKSLNLYISILLYLYTTLYL